MNFLTKFIKFYLWSRDTDSSVINEMLILDTNWREGSLVNAPV